MKQNTCFCLLIGYLCFSMAILPARLEGALLESDPSPASASRLSHSSPAAILPLLRAGLSYQEARTRLSLLRATDAEPMLTGRNPLIAGGDQDVKIHDTLAEAGYVFLIIAVCTGAAAAAAHRMSTK